MSKPFVVSTQYGDLKGTVSVDGFGGPGPFLQELIGKANMPADYVPVGLTCYLGEPSVHDKGLSDRFITFSIVAVKADKGDMDEIRRKAAATGTMDVFRFDIEGLKAEEILKLIKRLDIKLIWRGLENIEITEHDIP